MLILAFSLTACNGTAAPETTVAPETTAVPDEPVNVCESEGHTWADATYDVAKTTVLKVTVEDYRTIASDENHKALEGYGWEFTDGKYLHEVITDNTLLFRFD